MLSNSAKPSYSYVRRLMLLPLLALVTGLFAFTLNRQHTAGYTYEAASFADTTKSTAKKTGSATNKDTAATKNFIVHIEDHDKGQLKGKIKQITVRDGAVSVTANNVSFNNQISLTADTVVRVRTLQNVAPLFIVDGVQLSNINDIDAHDIETVLVLKNTAAVAIYGEGGKDGVIIITTKKNNRGKLLKDSVRTVNSE